MAVKRAPAFRGRTSECESLARLVTNVREGQSGVLVVSGEAGLGKTALLRHAVGHPSGFEVVQVAGIESEMELAYASLHQLCAQLLDRLERLPAPQRLALEIVFGLSVGAPPDRFLVGLGVLSLLSAAAEEQPLLCVVDDAQWLDQASVVTLTFVARRLLAEPVGIVFAVRQPNEGVFAGLPRLKLRGLGDEDARVLLASVVSGRLDRRVSDRIIAETRGNPLALLELAQGMAAPELAGFGPPEPKDLERRIEEHYRERIGALPQATRWLMLAAAADPVGDPEVVWRAAHILGVEMTAAEPAAAAQLLEIGARVRFHHPLVRSAVYGVASAADRRAVHRALADATDPETDPDRRVWHRANAAEAPDDELASELIESASRAQRRGGLAAAAAFLERAVTFTSGAGERASRALAAARAKFEAGDFASAQDLLVLAETGPLDDIGQALVERLRAQIAFDLRRGSDAPRLLLSAARRLESLDVDLAHETYLEALLAAIYAADLASGTSPADVGQSVLLAPRGVRPPAATELLAVGVATRLTAGYTAAAQSLRAGLHAYRAEEPRLDWSYLASSITAMELWDDEAWLELASRQVKMTRATGTLILLPYALDYLAGFHVQAGDLALAEALVEEAKALDGSIRAETLPYIPLRLAAWRGQAAAGISLADAIIREARERGEGCAVTVAHYATAILHNGLGEYELALDAAHKAAVSDDMAISSWALYELVEAASLSGRQEVARDAAGRLSERTTASGTRWAKGTEASSQALVVDGDMAESLHLEAIEWLGQTRMASYLARAQLAYGDWLRSKGRRTDAIAQLRAAREAFTSMGAVGFADRARRGLLAIGEKVPEARADARPALTRQEAQIARLARDGRTNQEIGAELFLSPRTIEWHLRKVFVKLGISSRLALGTALPGADTKAAAGPEPRKIKLRMP